MNCNTVYFIAGMVMGAMTGAAVALIVATLYFRKIFAETDRALDDSGATLDNAIVTMKYHLAELEQFNAGYDAFEAGEPIENCPSFEPDTDEWRIGWAWAQYHTLKDGAK